MCFYSNKETPRENPGEEKIIGGKKSHHKPTRRDVFMHL